MVKGWESAIWVATRGGTAWAANAAKKEMNRKKLIFLGNVIVVILSMCSTYYTREINSGVLSYSDAKSIIHDFLI
jgi:hypothetical protein